MSMMPTSAGGGSIFTDLYNTGKDYFLAKQYNDLALERQAKAIESQRVMQEAQIAKSRAEKESNTSNLVYIGGALVAIALFVTIFKAVT